jgi:hypothetical protein
MLIIWVLLVGVFPARADYSASDPKTEFAQSQYMNISHVSSRVFVGTFGGMKARLVRFQMRFYKDVPWKTLYFPRVIFLMDATGKPALDYRLEIFYLQDPSTGKKELHCWLERFGGRLVLYDTGLKAFSTSYRSAVCTFPKVAMRVRASGVVHWNASTSYGKSTPHLDWVPNDDHLFPHL